MYILIVCARSGPGHALRVKSVFKRATIPRQYDRLIIEDPKLVRAANLHVESCDLQWHKDGTDSWVVHTTGPDSVIRSLAVVVGWKVTGGLELLSKDEQDIVISRQGLCGHDISQT